MSFDWSQYLHLAEELRETAARSIVEEAKLRSAVSRAYYAAFCKARNYLRHIDRDPNIPEDGRIHSYIKNEFVKSSDRVRRRIGSNLDRLRSDRRKADYDNAVPGLHGMARVSLFLAKRVLSDLVRL